MVRDIRSTPLRYGVALGAIANHPITRSPNPPIAQSPNRPIVQSPDRQSGIMSAGCFPVAANKELDDVFTT